MTQLKFTKMHSLGNDFIVIDAIKNNIELTFEDIKFLADRNLGIGCDQILVVYPPRQKDDDFHMEIFNQDASKANQCGNGARCFALYVYTQNLTNKKRITISTKTSKIQAKIQRDGFITVNLGNPDFDLYKKFNLSSWCYEFSYKNQQLKGYILSLGNPHFVLFLDDFKEENDQKDLACYINSLDIFKDGINISFAFKIKDNFLEASFFERGAGQTLACGSGASALAISFLKITPRVDEKVILVLKHGQLHVKYKKNLNLIYLTGDAKKVFTGVIDLEKNE